MTDKLPTKFKDLGVAELRRSALEDFAVGVEPTDNKETVLAALEEGGVVWADYVAQHPEVAPKPAENVVTSPNPVNAENLSVGVVGEDAIAEPVVTNIRVQEPLVPAPTDRFLVKMIRDNPLYQTRGYTFTKAHPYALVSGPDLEYILTKEDGFRQALPSELAEFYG